MRRYTAWSVVKDQADSNNSVCGNDWWLHFCFARIRRYWCFDWRVGFYHPTVLNAYTKNWDLGQLAQKHRQAANDIWLIREKYLSLLTNLASGTPIDSVREERDKLLLELHAVYVGSPSTTYNAYEKAQQALQRHQDMTFTDQEIDAFLPKELRRSA